MAALATALLLGTSDELDLDIWFTLVGDDRG